LAENHGLQKFQVVLPYCKAMIYIVLMSMFCLTFDFTPAYLELET